MGEEVSIQELRKDKREKPEKEKPEKPDQPDKPEKSERTEEKKRDEEKKEPAKDEPGTEREPKTEKEPKEEKQEELAERKPWTRWTKRDRRNNIKKRRHGGMEKWFVTILFILLFIVFIGVTIYSITHQMDPAIITAMIALVVVILITAIFSISHVWYRSD